MIDTYGETPQSLQELLNRTPQGRAILHKLSGIDYPELLGASFWSKAKKAVKKVGKVTGKITGRIAKIAAGAVGIPPSAIDALAKVDPTAKNSLIANLAKSKAGQKAAAAIVAAEQQQQPTGKKANFFTNVKPAYIVAGAAGLAALAYMATKKGR